MAFAETPADMKHLYWKLRLAAKWLIIKLGIGPALIEYCKRCGIKQPLVWHAPDELWLEINDGKGGGIFCPECFTALAYEKKRYLITWTYESKRIWKIVDCAEADK